MLLEIGRSAVFATEYIVKRLLPRVPQARALEKQYTGR